MAAHSTVRETLDPEGPIPSTSGFVPSLFPIVPAHRDTEHPVPSPPERVADRVGIARLAASAPLADAKRGAEYFLLPARSILNRCDSNRVPFPWTVNPYRGCEFGCVYCYARYTHEYMELEPREFESKIFVKQETGPLAGRELRSIAGRGEHVAIGSATDPYQPAEREFGATRAVLEQAAEIPGLNLSITTKSDQVVRDLDLLRRIAERSTLTVNVTITTMRPRLARMLEPRAPRPDLRLGAMRTLREAGIAAGVFVMPVLPGLTDRADELEALARAARDAGAGWLLASVLFLMPSSRQQFFPFLEEKFPRLARRYREWYGRAVYAPENYRREIGELVASLRKKYGLGARPGTASRPEFAAPQQMTFAL